MKEHHGTQQCRRVNLEQRVNSLRTSRPREVPNTEELQNI